MPKWTRAQDVPKSWEGKQAFQWNEWDDYRPQITFIPREFSRKPHHCGGVWFMRFDWPAAPVTNGVLQMNGENDVAR